MKILHVINSFDIGGAEKLVHNYIIKTKNEYCNYVATLYKCNSFLNDNLIRNNIKFLYLYKYNVVIKLFKLIINIRKEKYDIVHCHLFPSGYYCAIASIFCKDTKFIFTEHSVTNKRRKYTIFMIIERILYKRFHTIVACTNYVQRELGKWLGKDFNIITINNGISELKRKDMELEYDLILVGSLRSDVKGVDIFLKALSNIKDSFNKAIIVGDGVEKEELLKLRDKLLLEDKVEFLGIRDDVERLLLKSKIFILPSRHEGLPLALLEAMSLSKAIIASDICDIPNIIINNESGILIKPTNIDEISNSIVELLKDDNKRIALGDFAYKRFKEKYSLEIYYKNIEKLYKK